MGIVILSAGLTLLLIPLTLAAAATDKWKNGSLIAMLVIGGICLVRILQSDTVKFVLTSDTDHIPVPRDVKKAGSYASLDTSSFDGPYSYRRLWCCIFLLWYEYRSQSQNKR